LEHYLSKVVNYLTGHGLDIGFTKFQKIKTYQIHTLVEGAWEKWSGKQSYLNKTLGSQNTWKEKSLRAESRGKILTPLTEAFCHGML